VIIERRAGNVLLFIVFGLSAWVLGSHLTAAPLHASGFALFTSGTAEIAQCGSVIAHTEGAASNYYNPALLPELEGTWIEAGVFPLKVSSDFKSDITGGKTSMEGNVFYPFTWFITHKINERFSAGLGINNTFGLGTEWKDDWEGRYIATNTDLETVNINPNLAWKVTDFLSLAAGLDILLGESTCEQKIDLNPFPDGHSKMTGDGEGYGYNLGLFYKVAENVAFGMSYRSGIKLKLKGDIKWTGPGAVVLADTGAKVDLDLPAQCVAGLSYRPFENLLFEIGGKWEGWSSYKNVKIRADQAIFVGSNVSTIPKDWKDVYGFNIGVKFNMDPTLSISAGFLHEGNPVPSSTFEPSVPVSDREDYSFGVQKFFGTLKVALAYVYDKYENRNKNNNVIGYADPASGITANGKYTQHVHMVGLSVSYRY